MLTLKNLFRLKGKAEKAQKAENVPKSLRVPFPVPSTREEDEAMLALAMSLSLHVSDDAKALNELENFTANSDEECSICFANIFERGAYMLQCCHMFCRECISRHVSTKLQANIYTIICPLCQEFVQEEDVRMLVDKRMHAKWLEESFKMHLEKNRDLYYHCPTPDCPTIVEKDLPDIVKCPTCNKSACIKCYNDHEENISCEQFFEWKALNGRAKEIFQAEVKRKKYQKCPRCKRFVEKISGCNHLTCLCGRKFNWIE